MLKINKTSATSYSPTSKLVILECKNLFNKYMVDKNFDEIIVGETASFSRKISEADIWDFTSLSGDQKPLHTDEAYAKETKFGGRIVHGMFLATLVSQLAGMYLPGKHCLLLSEELVFKLPARINDEILVVGTVIAKSQSTKIIEIKIEIKRGPDLLVEGAIKTQIL